MVMKMREILFRGKRVDNKEWCYGSYVDAKHHWHNRGVHRDWIVCSARSNGGWFATGEKHAVIHETVCEYTGLVDKNGCKIFEGDIVHLYGNDKQNRKYDWKAIVKFGNYNSKYSWGFQLKPLNDRKYNIDILLWQEMEMQGCENIYCEVIGTIFEITDYSR